MGLEVQFFIIPLWVKSTGAATKKKFQIQPTAKPSQGCINIDELNISCVCVLLVPLVNLVFEGEARWGEFS